jgi:hypothetical protein
MNRLLASIASVAWWLVPLTIIAAALGWETDWGRSLRLSPPVEAPVTPKPVAAAVLPDYVVAGGVAARPDTVARTLFNPTRRPAAAQVVEAPKPKMKRDQFVLTGTVVADGKRTAFLREVAGGKSRRVIQGESINGLTVADVQPNRVKLTFADESEDLTLKVVTNPKPTAVAAAPAAAPPQVPGQGPGQTPGTAPPAAQAGSAPADSADSLAARRRQARATQAAQAAQQGGSAAETTRTPQTPQAPAQAPSGADPAWAGVYQRYQQRAR